MPELPLIGGHAPGTSEKAESQTCINLFIESGEGDPYLRNRPGYDEVNTNAPTDVATDMDDLVKDGTTGKVDGSTTGYFYGYRVGDSITIAER